MNIKQDFRSDYLARVLLCGIGLSIGGCAATAESDWAKDRYRYYRVTYEETINVETYPQGAEVYLDDEFVGTSPVAINLRAEDVRVYWKFRAGTGHFDPLQLDQDSIEFPEHLLGVTHPGFFQAREILTLKDSPAFRATLDQYLPNPEAGSGQAQNTVPAVLTGERSIRVDLLPEAVSKAAMPSPDADAKTGQLRIVGADPTADIYVDGRFVGNAPAMLTLDPGSHLVELRRKEDTVFRKQIEILSGSQLTLNATAE